VAACFDLVANYECFFDFVSKIITAKHMLNVQMHPTLYFERFISCRHSIIKKDHNYASQPYASAR